MATDVAVGVPLGVTVWLVAVMVTGPMVDSDALLASTRVIDNDPPMHPLGIEASAMLVTTFAVTVHEIEMPDKVPHDVTLALAPTTFLVFAVALAAVAMPGVANVAAMTNASAGSRRVIAYPVMTTEMPVTPEAAMLLAVKSGEALPEASSVPVTSPSDALAAPVSVTL